MRILVITHQFPMYDRAAGDVRFFHMLRMLARAHEVSLSCYGIPQQIDRVGRADTERYRAGLASIGVQVADNDPQRLMRRTKFDALLFEFYHSAGCHLPEARILQPRAIKIIDTVDVHFNRMLSKARLTGAPADLRDAQRVKDVELAMYRKADLIIVVTDKDRDILLTEDPSLSTAIIPTIHPVVARPDDAEREPDSLLFVGGFDHDPNVDSVRYLCNEIMPLVWEEVPDAKVRVIGSSPPAAVRELASDRVEIVGYVPDIAPYLRASRVSVAPLRYGGGMKGKIGDALAAGLPVATTSIGIEGFGVVPGRDLLVADGARDFATAVIRLLRDQPFYDSISRAGQACIASRFSPEVVEKQLLALFDATPTMPRRALSAKDRVKIAIPPAVRYFFRRVRQA